MIKSSRGMGGEVIHHQDNLLGVARPTSITSCMKWAQSLPRFLLGHLDHPAFRRGVHMPGTG